MPKKTYGKTKSGIEITDELIEQYVAEAEQGFDLDKLKVRRGRPLLGCAPSTTFAVRLDPDLRTALDERAARDGLSSAAVLRKALRRYLAEPQWAPIEAVRPRTYVRSRANGASTSPHGPRARIPTDDVG